MAVHRQSNCLFCGASLKGVYKETPGFIGDTFVRWEECPCHKSFIQLQELEALKDFQKLVGSLFSYQLRYNMTGHPKYLKEQEKFIQQHESKKP